MAAPTQDRDPVSRGGSLPKRPGVCRMEESVITQHNAGGGDGDDSAFAIERAPSGDLWITGRSDTSDGTGDMVLWRFR